MTRRAITAAMLGVVLVSLAGCGSGGPAAPAPTAPPTRSHPVHSPSPTSPSPTSPSTRSGSPSPSAPVAAACATGQLQLSLGQQQGTPGNFYLPIVLTNTGSAPCTLDGYPGVSYVDAAGRQVGPAAERRSDPVHIVTLAASGGQASALLHQPDPSAFPPARCQPEAATRLRVYPPGQYTPLTIGYHTSVCTSAKTGVSDIGPMQKGDNPTL